MHVAEVEFPSYSLSVDGQEGTASWKVCGESCLNQCGGVHVLMQTAVLQSSTMASSQQQLEHEQLYSDVTSLIRGYLIKHRDRSSKVWETRLNGRGAGHETSLSGYIMCCVGGGLQKARRASQAN